MTTNIPRNDVDGLSNPSLRDLLRAITPPKSNHVAGPFNASIVACCARIVGHEPRLSDLDGETLARITGAIVDHFDPINIVTGKRGPRTGPGAQTAARRVQRLADAVEFGRMRVAKIGREPSTFGRDSRSAK